MREYWKMGMLEYWNGGILERWNSEIVEYWNAGMKTKNLELAIITIRIFFYHPAFHLGNICT